MPTKSLKISRPKGPCLLISKFKVMVNLPIRLEALKIWAHCSYRLNLPWKTTLEESGHLPNPSSFRQSCHHKKQIYQRSSGVPDFWWKLVSLWSNELRIDSKNERGSRKTLSTSKPFKKCRKNKLLPSWNWNLNRTNLQLAEWCKPRRKIFLIPSRTTTTLL